MCTGCEHFKGCGFHVGARTVPHTRTVGGREEVVDFHFADDMTTCGCYVSNVPPPLYTVIEMFPHLAEALGRVN